MNIKPQPFLSFCIPTYNNANELRATLDSILMQIGKSDHQFEIIISDNCSVDQTELICKEFCRNYSFIKSDNSQSNITINTKFGTWNYVNDNGISERMPWRQNDCGVLTTDNGGGNWWGTLISKCGWSPTPWIWDAGGGTPNPDPGVIWYWVR